MQVHGWSFRAGLQANMSASSTNSSTKDSCLIREHSKELIRVLTLSKPARQTLTIAIYSQFVLDDMEKLEIMDESLSAMTSADKLVGYIISRIDSREHCDKIWKELDNVEALRDIVKKMRSKRG